MDASEHKPAKQTYTWSTPFFDVEFVDIRTRKDASPSETRKRSLSRRREAGARRDRSGSCPQVMPDRQLASQPDLLDSEAERRILRYKEERRRQLAAHVASRLGSGNLSSTDEEDDQADRCSYTEFRRRKKRERGVNKQELLAANNASDAISAVGSYSRSSQDSLAGGGGNERSCAVQQQPPEPPSRDKYGSLRRRSSQAPAGVVSGEGTVSRESGFSLSTPGSRDNLNRDWEAEQPQRDTTTSAAASNNRPLLFDGSSSVSREGSSGSRDCLPSPDRDGLVSPDIIRTVASTIQPSPRRRINNQDEGLSTTTARFPALQLSAARAAAATAHPPSPGSVLSPTSTTPSASKPPIFPSPDRNSNGFRFSLRKSSDSPPYLRYDSKSDSEPPPFLKEFAGVVRRRSGQYATSESGAAANPLGFNPNEPAPPKPSPRPHSVYRMEGSPINRQSEPDLSLGLSDKERRKSDFLSHYQELTCRAALAIKTVDQIAAPVAQPPPPVPLLPSPLSPGAESVEFNEEEVLKTCQDFLVDYNKAKQQNNSPPIPAPRFSLTQGRSLSSPGRSPSAYSRSSQSALSSPVHTRPGPAALANPPVHARPGPPALTSPPVLARPGLPGRVGTARPLSELSQEDEQLLEAAQGKQFWEGAERPEKTITFRTRSSSFSMPDRSSAFLPESSPADHNPVGLRPILKKSTEDLATFTIHSLPNSTISILKNRDDAFGKAKRRSAGEEGGGGSSFGGGGGKNEHVRIRSPSLNSRGEHVRIRTPSPEDLSSSSSEGARMSSPQPPPVPCARGRRSRSNSCREGDILLTDDAEIPSILKRRRASADDLGWLETAAVGGSHSSRPLSPTERASILKRKSSFGSNYSGSHSNYSGRNSPDVGSENTRSILKKWSRNSSRTCSRSGSVEDLDVEGTKSILKSRNSSRTCSRSESQEDLDMDLDEEEEWLEPRPKSILKKRQGSTDDELEERPKSILKSRHSSPPPPLKFRRSEDSPSPGLEQQEYFHPSREGSVSATRQSSVVSDSETGQARSGCASPLSGASGGGAEHHIRPILKNRDEGPTSILKRRDKSSSPLRGDEGGGGRHSPTAGRSQGGSRPVWTASSSRGQVASKANIIVEAGPVRGIRVASPPGQIWRCAPPLRRRQGSSPPAYQQQEDEEEEEEVLCIQQITPADQDSPTSESPGTAGDPSKLSLSERVRLFNGLSDQQQRSVISRPPRAAAQQQAAARRCRRKLNRFQTQPITVDEVEKARRGFLSSYQDANGNQRTTSPLFAMLRPVSLEELCGEIAVSVARRPLLPPSTAAPLHRAAPARIVPALRSDTGSPPLPAVASLRFASPPSAAASQNTTALLSRSLRVRPAEAPEGRASLPPPVRSPDSPPNDETLLARASLFRPVFSPPPSDRRCGSPPGFYSPPTSEERSPSPLRNLMRQVPMASPPRLARPSAFRPVPAREQSSPPDLTPVSGPIPRGSHPPPSPASSDQLISDRARRYAALRVVEKDDPPALEELPQQRDQGAWDEGCGSRAADNWHSSTEDLQGILKRNSTAGLGPKSVHSSDTKTPKKSILKNDSVDELMSLLPRDGGGAPFAASVSRGVLKKDSSYDSQQLAAALSSSSPPPAAPPSSSSLPGRGRSNSNSSCDDIGRSFSDVVIDPIPGQGRKSNPETPVKRSRTPVIPPSSVKISADGNLAGKLAKLSMQADSIKMRMSSEDRGDPEPEPVPQNKSKSLSHHPPHHQLPPRANNNSTATAISTTPAASSTSSLPRPRRKSDLPAAEDFYAIYQQHKRRDSLSPTSSQSSSSSHRNINNGGGETPPSPPRSSSSRRGSLRQRSASPQFRQGVDFWEEEVGRRGGRSQERTPPPYPPSIAMPGKTDVHVSGGGIMDRLASLQKHGDEDWRRRAQVHTPDILLTARTPATASEVVGSGVQLRRSQTVRNSSSSSTAAVAGGDVSTRPVSLMDRMSRLNEAQAQWQKKVEDKDSKKFTVQGKMERDQLVRSVMAGDSAAARPADPSATPTINAAAVTPRAAFSERGARRTPKMRRFCGSSQVADKTKSAARSARPVSLFVDAPAPGKGASGNGLVRSNSLKRIPEYGVASSPPSATDYDLSPQMESAIDLDTAVAYQPQLGVRKAVAAPRRTRAARNPVKSLLAREDLVEHLEDLRFQDTPAKKVEMDKLSKHSHLTAEALAGLASTEDFTSVQLRRGNAVVPHQNLLPYRDKMLLQVKGRRFCQTRLVEPVSASINSGDCFILVTQTEVFNWMGRFSNVIERARAAEVATTILHKKDLGCKSTNPVITIDEERLIQCSRENRKFWSALAGTEPGEVRPAGPPQEDEDYEQAIVEASCVYAVEEDRELVPVEAGWGLAPRHALLEPSRVLVFDFGSEVYVYNGKNAAFETRKAGARLAQELWSTGWDYTDCSINPVYGFINNMKADSRPEWTVLGRITSNMETILFREKFIDWPDKSRVIGKAVGGKEEERPLVDVNTPPAWAWADLAGWSGAELTAMERPDPDLQLEGAHLGRGQEFYDLEERRQYVVETLGVKAWHVEENESRPLPDSFTGQFHTADTYVIRWKYKVALTGRNLKGGASKYSAVGRDRCAYFFWQGAASKISLQGASALQTVELDSEKGPQLRVREGQEHAAFLALWAGNMVIYRGRRNSSNSQQPWRLFLVRGQVAGETYLKELECNHKSLRSQGVFILVGQGKIYLWIGANAARHVADMGQEAGRRLAARLPAEMGQVGSTDLSLTRLEDGTEGRAAGEFWEALGGNRDAYKSRSEGDWRLSSTPRLYQMSSVLGRFEVAEILPDQMRGGVPNPLLFNQAQLYEAEQPGLFMLDAEKVVYLWQGWQEPDSDLPSEGAGASTTTGSGEVRWHAERRAAMSTLLSYLAAAGRPNGIARLVWAGHEPAQFINLFPEWTVREDVHLYNVKAAVEEDVRAVYACLSRSEYSWTELTSRPLPPGVDPARIELYLPDATFQEKFKMTKTEFTSSPRWKQIEMKKEVGLF